MDRPMGPAAQGLLGPHLRLCRLQEGQRILLQLSTWAATLVTSLWTHFQEHVTALEPLPTLPPYRMPTCTTQSPQPRP